MTNATMTLSDGRMHIKTVAGTVAGALRTHILTETPSTFGELRDAVWEILPASERSSAADVAGCLVREARGAIVHVDDEADRTDALDRALGL